MNLTKVTVENFRLLKDFSIDVESELSLVVGKNNTGKTSLLSVLDKFLSSTNNSHFSYDDFNIDFRTEFQKVISGQQQPPESYSPAIVLKLYIKYDENDDLSNINEVMMDLDDDINMVVLRYEYSVNTTIGEITRKFNDFIATQLKKEEKDTGNMDERDSKELTDKERLDFAHKFLTENHSKLFSVKIFSVALKPQAAGGEDKLKAQDHLFVEDDSDVLELSTRRDVLRKILNFKYISAKRSVTNKDTNKTLSVQAASIYDKIVSNNGESEAVEMFKDQLQSTDALLTQAYDKIFKQCLNKIKTFGGIKANESILQICSTLQHRDLLKGNTTVTYDHCGNQLPEHYNGLGYMNLISIIFEIEIMLYEFQRSSAESPADLNLLFIEEPEAHTHPQMQYIFIKNIKELLKSGIEKDGTVHRLQYFITTHSSHIVSQSDFNDIKYLKKENECVEARNLRELQQLFKKSKIEDSAYRFLVQYLTLNKAELFFADKAILIEGDTERILLPAMMKKIDLTQLHVLPKEHDRVPLLSQNISIVEVGANSKTFSEFFQFIGLEKCLIITDLDSCEQVVNGQRKDGEPKYTSKASPVADGIETSNASLNYFFADDVDDFDSFKKQSFDDGIFTDNGMSWHKDENGWLAVTYQKEEEGYQARSFEDAFFHLNRELFEKKDDSDEEVKIFHSLKPTYLKKFREEKITVYEFAECGVDKKSALAIDILMNSDDDFSNWEIPAYIKEGLIWIQK